MTIRLYTKVVFFLVLLISSSPCSISAQEAKSDTLKNVKAPEPEGEDELEEEITYEAQDSMVAIGAGQLLILYGKAKLTYGSMNIQAEVIEMDYKKNIVVAYGKQDSTGKMFGEPVFKDAEQEIKAQKIMYNLKTQRGKIFGALTRQGEFLVYGNEIKKDSNNVVYLKGMKCIPCKEEDSRTMFRATRAKIIPDDKIVTGPMFLEIGGAPTPIGLPFGFFPNAKKSHNGILIPTVGHSDNWSYFMKNLGYYWGISDKTDMIVYTDLYSNGSWALRTINSYDVLYKAKGDFAFGYNRIIEGDKDIPGESYVVPTYSVAWNHFQDNKSNPTIRFSADVNMSSPDYNKYSPQNSGQYLSNTFLSNVAFTKSFKWSSLSLNASHNQNNQNRQVNLVFPSLTYNVNRFFPFRSSSRTRNEIFDKLGISYILTGQNTLSGADSTIFKGNLADSIKYGFQHSLPISTNFNFLRYITVTPALNLKAYMYPRTIRKEYDTAGVVSTKNVKGYSDAYEYNFSTGLTTKLYFDYSTKRGWLSQVRHLMIPTISYVYRPDYGQEKYGYWNSVQKDSIGNRESYSIYANSIYGGPSRGTQNLVNFSLSNNIEAKLKQRTDTGINYVKTTVLQDLGVNTYYNFAADSFKMNYINLSARSKVLKYFDVTARATYDPYSYNKENRRIEQYAWNYSGKLATFQSAGLTVNSSFGSNMLEALKKTREAPKITNAVEPGAKRPPDQGPRSLSWNLSAYYNLVVNRVSEGKNDMTQTMTFSGDIMPTKFWKVGMTSGYDFKMKGLTYTSINIYRDLKCWELAISWVPFGFRKSYSVYLNLKTPSLSSVKVPRQKQWFDNIQ